MVPEGWLGLRWRKPFLHEFTLGKIISSSLQLVGQFQSNFFTNHPCNNEIQVCKNAKIKWNH
jgi:hypothetical protein